MCVHLIYPRNANCQIQLETLASSSQDQEIRKEEEDIKGEQLFFVLVDDAFLCPRKYSFNPKQIVILKTERMYRK